VDQQRAAVVAVERGELERLVESGGKRQGRAAADLRLGVAGAQDDLGRRAAGQLVATEGDVAVELDDRPLQRERRVLLVERECRVDRQRDVGRA